MSTSGVRLYVDGNERDFLNLHYIKSHPNPDPDTFDLRLTPEEASDIDYFDVVDIRKNGVTEFYGFVEEITPEIGEDGLEYYITGRCWKLITWKKHTERFQESREVGPANIEGELESGFFGDIYPHELIKFIMRSPMSSHPQNFIRQKIGWGIPTDYWDCCASHTADSHYPEWVCLRYTGLAWKDRAGHEELNGQILVVNSFNNLYNEWRTFGASPWLDTDDELGSYIHQDVSVSDGSRQGDFDFQNLPATADTINSVILYVKTRGGGQSQILVRLYDGTDWHNIGYLNDYPWGWGTDEFNVTSILNTQAKIDSAKVRFQKFGEPRLNEGNSITYAYLNVIYTVVVDVAYQHADEHFIIDMAEPYDRVTAILLECRNNPENYARHYTIQYCDLSNCCGTPAPLESEWQDFDPAINVTSNTARDILHSWKPQDDVRCIRIKLTASASAPWEISQAYVWQGDPLKYCLIGSGN